MLFYPPPCKKWLKRWPPKIDRTVLDLECLLTQCALIPLCLCPLEYLGGGTKAGNRERTICWFIFPKASSNQNWAKPTPGALELYPVAIRSLSHHPLFPNHICRKLDRKQSSWDWNVALHCGARGVPKGNLTSLLHPTCPQGIPFFRLSFLLYCASSLCCQYCVCVCK